MKFNTTGKHAVATVIVIAIVIVNTPSALNPLSHCSRKTVCLTCFYSSVQLPVIRYVKFNYRIKNLPVV
jgi:hypothetical protein